MTYLNIGPSVSEPFPSQLPTPPFSARLPGSVQSSTPGSDPGDSLHEPLSVHHPVQNIELSSKRTISKSLPSPPSSGQYQNPLPTSPRMHIQYQVAPGYDSAPGKEHRNVTAMVRLVGPSDAKNLEAIPATESESSAAATTKIYQRFFARPQTTKDLFAKISRAPELLSRPITADLRFDVQTEHKIDFLRQSIGEEDQTYLQNTGNFLLEGPINIRIASESQTLRCYLFEKLLLMVKGHATQQLADQSGALSGVIVLAQIEDLLLLPERSGPAIRIILGRHTGVHTVDCRFEDQSSKMKWLSALQDASRIESRSPPKTNRSTVSPRHLKELPVIPPGFKEARGARTSVPMPSEKLEPIVLPQSMNVSLEESRSVYSCTPVDCVVVVPVSSSMKGLKFACLQEALSSLVAGLNPQDRFGLILYGVDTGQISVEIELNQALDIRYSCGVVEHLRLHKKHDSGQDIMVALHRALRMFGESAPRHCLSHMLVLSDSAHLMPDMSEAVSHLFKARRIMVHNFGYGPTHDMSPLVALSEDTYGSYTFIKDFAGLKDSILACFTGLRAISHADLCLYFVVPNQMGTISIKIKQIIGANHSRICPDGQTGKIWIPALYYCQTRDFLVDLVIEGPPDEAITSLDILQASTSFRHPARTDCFIKSKYSAKLSISPMVSPNAPSAFDSLITIRQLELLVCDVLSRTLQLMGGSQKPAALCALSEAQKVLKKMTTIHPFDAVNKGLILDLYSDLAQISNAAMSEQGFDHFGKKQVVHLIQALRDQKAWTVDLKSSRRYHVNTKNDPGMVQMSKE